MERTTTTVLFLASLALALAAMAQTNVTISEKSPAEGVTFKYSYDAGNRLEYEGRADSVQPAEIAAVVCGSAPRCSTLTSIVVSSNTGTVNQTAHGYSVGNEVCVSGASVDADLNACYNIQTVPGANSYTITTANVSDATYNEASLRVESTAPRAVRPVWCIQKLVYDAASGVLLHKYWSRGRSGACSAVWDNRAVTTGANRTSYQ